MYKPHPTMSKALLEDIYASDFVWKPMPIHYEETREERCLKKPVLKSKLLDSMESLENWSAITQYAHMEISKERFIDGESSLKFTAPCKLDHWPGPKKGRIYAVPKVMRSFDRENWEDYNRLSVWIYPDMPGYRSVCLRIQLHNDGVEKIPDVFDRKGGHNINLKNHEWNHITVEIPSTPRDAVIGISFEYDMVGHEPSATDTACWYIDKLELQLVDQDLDEGWEVDKNKIAFSHSGYQPGAAKTAVASVLTSDEFSIFDAHSGKKVLTKPVNTISTINGEYKIMEFTELTKEGEYFLVCGDKITPTFAINNRVWMSSIWKTLNFFFLQRCGYRVPNKHQACHFDSLTLHGNMWVVANGGWHDAGDMAQQQPNTAEVTNAMFELAMQVKRDDPILYKRLIAEATWGLEFLLKTRFGDGYRTTDSGGSCWSDGIRGTNDDIENEAKNDAFSNLVASAAEAIAYFALINEDRELAIYSLKCAKEDLAFALEFIDAKTYNPAETEKHHTRMVSKSVIAGAIVYAAMLIYRATGEQYYADKAVEYGDYIVRTQQTRYEDDWDEPIIGFFYREEDKKNIIHYNHRSHEEKQNLGLIELCKQLPNHPDWMKWYSALIFHAFYIKKLMSYVAPYGMLPSGIYSLDEIEDLETFKTIHPITLSDAGGTYEEQLEEILKNYKEQLEYGIKIGPKHYIRRFPVWYSFRGNTAVQLSAGKAVSATSIYLNDYELYDIAQKQFQFIIGYNPFGQSIMYGEGYDYGQLYAVLPGDMVGALPVGMQTKDEGDAPYWPQLNNCTYKEVWVASSGKWLWMMADQYIPAKIIANFIGKYNEEVVFINKITSAKYVFSLENGLLNCELPAGQYDMICDDQYREITVVPGGTYNIKTPLASFSLKKEVFDNGKVRLVVTGIGSGKVSLELRVRGLRTDTFKKEIDLDSDEQVSFNCEIEDEKEAWAAVVIPDGNMDEIVSIIG